MIFHYKKSKILYWVILVFSFIIFFLFFSRSGISKEGSVISGIPTFSFGVNIKNQFLYGVVETIAFGAVFFMPAFPAYYVAAKEDKKLLDLILDRCEPEQFIREYYYIASKKTKNINIKLYTKINLCLGYFGQEDYDTIIEVMLLLLQEQIKKDSYSLFLKSFIHYNLCTCYLSKHNNSKVNAYFQKFNEDKAVLQASRKYGNVYTKMYRMLQNRMSIGDIGIDEAIRRFLEEMSECKNNYSMVKTKFKLGQLYLKAANQDKAKECFQYVVDHGNKLAIIPKAQQELLLLNENKQTEGE